MKRSLMKIMQPPSSGAELIQSQSTLDLIDKLSPFVVFDRVPAGRRFFYTVEDVRMCYLIRSGRVRIRRDVDELVVVSLPVPNVAGIANLLPVESGLFIETMDECELACLTATQARQLVEQTNAWEELAGHISKVAANLFNHNVIMTAPTAYEIIRFQLLALMQEQSDIRQATTAAKYVLQRTRLSRSSVMKILAQLKQGGYIQLEDGVLTSLNHLPAKY